MSGSVVDARRATRRASIVLLAIALAVAGAPTRAQTSPPFEAPLLRLAERMGALHHLRGLCGGSEGGVWRDKMAALIDAQAQDADLRERLAGAFNRGYRTFLLTYRSCNDQARRIIDDYLVDVERLSGDIASRYGD